MDRRLLYIEMAFYTTLELTVKTRTFESLSMKAIVNNATLGMIYLYAIIFGVGVRIACPDREVMRDLDSGTSGCLAPTSFYIYILERKNIINLGGSRGTIKNVYEQVQIFTFAGSINMDYVPVLSPCQRR